MITALKRTAAGELGQQHLSRRLVLIAHKSKPEQEATKRKLVAHVRVGISVLHRDSLLLFRQLAEGNDKQGMEFNNNNALIDIKSEHGVAAALEARRIADKYQRDFLSCEDLVDILAVGKNNVRELMKSDRFPTIEIGNRKVVSVISFVLWSMENNHKYFF